MAVYTPLTVDDIRAHLTHYNLGGLVAHAGISEGVENTNYRIETERGLFILTLFEKRVDKKALPFYFDFMRALHDQGIPTAEVMPATDGSPTKTLAGKTALITRFLQGTWPKAPTPEHTAAIGTLLARMHQVGGALKQNRANDMSLPAWVSLIQASGHRADEVHAGLEAELKGALKAVESHFPRDLPQGVVHADLFPDNVFFDEGNKVSGVIDFYFACRDSFAYDLMLTLNAWCFTPFGDVDSARARALIQAYHQTRPLTPAETAALPVLGMAAALRIVATRLYDYLHPAPHAMVRAKDPMEHVHLLRYHRAAADSSGRYDWWPV